ncbi:MAG: pentapeptide repeat-containing protein [Pseudomonadota bacterium]
MSDAPPEIARINALTTNARNTWFVLLSALVFVGITLMGVEHIDFYGVDRGTTLPVVNFDIPTRAFFIAAPILLAAVYGYLHLYLIRLWDALGTAEPRIAEETLGDAILPWLVNDAALALRLWRRQDGSTRRRTLEIGAMFLNVLIAWALTPFIIAMLWWMSMPARDWLITSAGGLALLACLLTCYASLRLVWIRMGPPATWPARPVTTELTCVIGGILLVPGVLLVGHSRTVSPSDWIALAPIEIIGEAIVERPQGWLPHDVARKHFFAAWCERESTQCELSALTRSERDAFDDEWKARRDAALKDMRRPHWQKPGQTKPDFLNARLDGSFLNGTDLRGARLEGARLADARLEGALLAGAKLEGAILSRARLEGADLFEAQLSGANFNGARLDGSKIGFAKLQGTVLLEAQMNGADLSFSQMQGAALSRAELQGAILSNTRMDGAVLSDVNMTGAFLDNARMPGTILVNAILNRATLTGVTLDGATLSGAQLNAAVLTTASLENALVNGASLRGAILSGAVLNGANFNDAALDDAILSDARMARAELRDASLDGAMLNDARLGGAVLSGASLERAQLTGARMTGTLLNGARLHDAALDRSHIAGRADLKLELKATYLNGVRNKAGAMRYADLSQAIWDEKTDFRLAFLDGTSTLPEGFYARMGKPCQWVIGQELTAPEFYSLWRWWLQQTGEALYLRDPPRYLQVPDATPKLLAKYGLTDCKPGHAFGPMPG